MVGLSVINPNSALLLLSSSDDGCCYTVIYMEWKEQILMCCTWQNSCYIHI